MEPIADDYVPVALADFINGVLIPVDLHIRLSDDKFVLIAKSGTQSDVQQFKNYKNHEVHYLWVKKEDFPRMSQQAITLAGLALTKKDLSAKQKTSLLTHAARATFQQLHHIGFDGEVYNNSKVITEAVVNVVQSHQTLNEMFNSLASVSDHLLKHSIAVSTISVMLGNLLAYQKRATLEKLALGGLLHDVGLKAIPPEIANKPMAAMTHEELKAYETHPFKGMQMMHSLGIVPDDVVAIVYEHHENANGQGFPQRLRDIKMHPLSKVVALADAYAELIIEGPSCPKPRRPIDALHYLEVTLGGPFNKEVFRALRLMLAKESLAG